jgi:hypothetical protein
MARPCTSRRRRMPGRTRRRSRARGVVISSMLVTLKNAATIAGVMLLLAGGPVPGAAGQQFIATGHDTLRGLPGVEVMVDDPQPELERAGLTGPSLKADVEGMLRSHGILVYRSQAENASPAKPYLYLHLNALSVPGDHVAVAVQLHLRQTLRSPATSSNVVDAMTWDQHSIVSVPAADLQAVRAAVRAHVDVFIEDWLSVHK